MRIGITAKNWKPLQNQNSAVLGFLDIVMPLPGGGTVTIQGCRYCYSDRKGADWVGYPEREYTRDGEKAYARIIWIEGRDISDAFQAEATEAARALYHGAKGQPAPRGGGGNWGGRW